MKYHQTIQHFARRAGFTLIELLVVIGIIAILAAMIFPASNIIKVNGLRKKAKAELQQVALAIDSYQAKYGHYPPDNPGNPLLNQLFYELHGTLRTNIAGADVFQTLDGRTSLPVGSVSTAFGTGVGGFVNCTKGGGDDLGAAKKCINNLKPGQYGFLNNGAAVLTTSVNWPSKYGPVLTGAPADLNPIRYNSSSPTNNPKSYDLWVDIVAGGKTNRISNWNEQPENVSY